MWGLGSKELVVQSWVYRHHEGHIPFQIEDIATNDSLVRFYTAWICIVWGPANFLDFLVPSAHYLIYWGSSDTKSGHRWGKKLTERTISQFFLTFVKLRLNLRVKDFAWRFAVLVGLVSLVHRSVDLFLVPTPKRCWMDAKCETSLPSCDFKEEY